MAQNEFERAIELDPQAASALQWYAEHLAITGQFEEAVARIRMAEVFEPLDVSIKAVHGWILMCGGRTELAHSKLAEALEMDPDHPLANWFLGQLFFSEGAYPRAVEVLERAAELNDNGSRMTADLASALAMEGNDLRARRLLASLQRSQAAGENVSMYESAIVHAALGEHDEAFGQLEGALAERTWQVANLAVDPMLTPLRADSRFNTLLARAGLGRTTPDV